VNFKVQSAVFVEPYQLFR